MPKYQLTTYDGETYTVQEDDREKVNKMISYFELMPVKMADGTTELFAKNSVQHMKMVQDEQKLPPEQRLAMGGQKDNRSEGPEAEANRAWRKECGHDYKRMANKQERDAFIANWLRDNAQQ